MAPLCAVEALDVRGLGDQAAVRQDLAERERLPERRVLDRRAGGVDDQRLVPGGESRVGEVQRLVRAVVPAGGDHGRAIRFPSAAGEAPRVVVKSGE